MAIKFESYFDKLSSDPKKKSRCFISNAGSKFVPVYEYDVIDGIKTLIPVGEHDIQAEIDSYADQADINNIINRFLNGDTSVLNPKLGTYGDFSDVPTTYAELFSRVQKCQNVFDSLPVEIRSKFDNSYEKFWSDFGSDSFDAVFDEYNSKFGQQSGAGVSESVNANVDVNSEVPDAK